MLTSSDGSTVHVRANPSAYRSVTYWHENPHPYNCHTIAKQRVRDPVRVPVRIRARHPRRLIGGAVKLQRHRRDLLRVQLLAAVRDPHPSARSAVPYTALPSMFSAHQFGMIELNRLHVGALERLWLITASR